jgi:hypothetical protein
MLGRHCANHVYDLGFAVHIKERHHFGSADATTVGPQAGQRAMSGRCSPTKPTMSLSSKFCSRMNPRTQESARKRRR